MIWLKIKKKCFHLVSAWLTRTIVIYDIYILSTTNLRNIVQIYGSYGPGLRVNLAVSFFLTVRCFKGMRVSRSRGLCPTLALQRTCRAGEGCWDVGMFSTETERDNKRKEKKVYRSVFKFVEKSPVFVHFYRFVRLVACTGRTCLEPGNVSMTFGMIFNPGGILLLDLTYDSEVERLRGWYVRSMCWAGKYGKIWKNCIHWFIQVSFISDLCLASLTSLLRYAIFALFAQVMLAQKAGEEFCDLAEAECREERWNMIEHDGKMCWSGQTERPVIKLQSARQNLKSEKFSKGHQNRQMMQIYADSCRYMQIHADICRFMQIIQIMQLQEVDGKRGWEGRSKVQAARTRPNCKTCISIAPREFQEEFHALTTTSCGKDRHNQTYYIFINCRTALDRSFDLVWFRRFVCWGDFDNNEEIWKDRMLVKFLNVKRILFVGMPSTPRGRFMMDMDGHSVIL